MSQQVDFVLGWMRRAMPSSVVYIGWRKDTNLSPMAWCASAGANLTIVEAFAPNALYAESLGYHVVQGDVVQLIRDRSMPSAAAIIWLHGPEHVGRDDMWYALGRMSAWCRNILIQAPIGQDNQGEYLGNPYEAHMQSLVPKDFERMGWETASHNTDGENTFSAWTNWMAK